jgi:hypothetical protein|tara:strand:- start:206 stop:496 length:291 start_codon:yes stop_codon:yes gene_type:complete
MAQEIKEHVNSIAQDITDGKHQAGDWMEDVLDIQYIINQDKTYRGARILVAFGGPNIWVNTQSGQVEGYWWGDNAFAGFIDNIGLDDFLEEMYSCS